MPRLESNNAGMLAAYWRGVGNEEAAVHWGHMCTACDYAIPGFEPDNSKNYAIALQCGRGDWQSMEGFLGQFDKIGWQIREFNSPLYTGKTYASTIIGAALSGSDKIVEYATRWTALLSLQAVFVQGKKRLPRKMDFGGVKTRQGCDRSTPLWIPPTGIRANALGGNSAEPVLATVLGFPWETHRKFDPDAVPERRSEWTNRRGARLYGTLAYAVRKALERSPIKYKVDGFIRHCRNCIRNSNLRSARRLANVIGDIRLHRGLDKFLIERRDDERGDAVLTAWSGKSPTTQKPCIPASSIYGDRLSVLAPSKMVIPSTVVRSRITDYAVEASGDESGRMKLMYVDPSWTLKLYRDSSPRFIF